MKDNPPKVSLDQASEVLVLTAEVQSSSLHECKMDFPLSCGTKGHTLVTAIPSGLRTITADVSGSLEHQLVRFC